MVQTIDQQPVADQKLSWDLSQSNHIDQVDWPAEHPTSVLHYSDATVTVSLPDGHTVTDWNASNIYVNRGSGEQIYTLSIRTQPLTMDEAHKRGVELAQQFGLAHAPIDEWYNAYKNEPAHLQQHFLTYAALRDTGNGTQNEPDVVIESAKSFNDENPWIVDLSFVWNSAQ